MVGARAAGTPRLTEDIAAVADVMDVDNVQMYNERVSGSGRETLYARTDEISVAFHAALPFEVRRELKGAGVSILLQLQSLKPTLILHRLLFSILDRCSRCPYGVRPCHILECLFRLASH